jgi:hypothetical protein
MAIPRTRKSNMFAATVKPSVPAFDDGNFSHNRFPLTVARFSPYLRHALTGPLGQPATSHARHTWLLADRD